MIRSPSVCEHPWRKGPTLKLLREKLKELGLSSRSLWLSPSSQQFDSNEELL